MVSLRAEMLWQEIRHNFLFCFPPFCPYSQLSFHNSLFTFCIFRNTQTSLICFETASEKLKISHFFSKYRVSNINLQKISIYSYLRCCKSHSLLHLCIVSIILLSISKTSICYLFHRTRFFFRHFLPYFFLFHISSLVIFLLKYII